jgi:hypothetical protein
MPNTEETVVVLHADPGGNSVARVNVFAPGTLAGPTGTYPTLISGGTTGLNREVVGVTGGTNPLFKTVQITNGW